MKLKNINFGLGLVALLALSSCADDKFSEYRTDMTKNLKEYQYLNNYEPLKKYVEDMKASGKCNPDFKLGIALAAPDFNKQELVYCLAGSNFEEMTAGNAMKYASCVKNDGTFDFNTVKDFVTNAQDAGLTIYGHTLAWHSQQNKKYLSKLIADKEIQVDPSQKVDKVDAYTDFSAMNSFPFYVMDYTPEIKDGILISKYPGKWYQYFVVDNYPVDVDAKREYKVTAMIKASEDGQIDVQTGNWGATTSQKMSVSTQWKEQSVTFSGLTTEKAFVVFQPGDFAGDISCKWVKVTHSEAPVMEIETEVHKETYTDGDFPFYAMGCTPPVINGAIHFVPTGEWSQFFVMPGGDNELDEGDYVVYLDLTSDKDASGVDLTMQNGWGGTAQAITAKVPVAAGRHSVKIEMPKVEGGNYDIILKPQTADATLDVHSVRVCKVTKSNSIPLTDEEKKSRLTDAMGKWIDGMMEATDGYVTSWEVVNEALSGKDYDGDGKFDLQSAKRGNVSADDAKNNFYWQDYLGDIDYVRTAVADARKSFAAHNGDPEKLKLFINDYNLESDWDDNGKLKSLIQWIKDWEADGVTKIDGIASQMHISCYADPKTQESKKNHIVKMLELMKESGKLCKISELDMGYVDAAGKEVKTADITEEQHKEMRDLYTFVLQKYFEIIPAAQQYGITQWCATDAPKDSGWRPGLPVGLWDLNYLRKHTYAGFAVGLGAPEYWKEAK
ncbi:endo-1,4-beta-xylanase [Segatella copri]|uniref:Beta-xylanase n=1 Tax=Segatella copri TaxID=165179 RepID=A0AA92T6H9_9BACT|nr:endo-1,4-beta-xylanase [Segatella copri]RGN12356.1 glycosyl hydrolase family 10 [Segatella copri]RGQ12579.1 glycosyl hydrolase family 10 [Segatella copri]